MSGKTLRSSLIVSLIDKVSRPSRNIARSLLGIRAATGKLEGATFANRLTGAIRDNDHALRRARGGLVDAVAGFYTLRTAIAAPVRAAMNLESSLADVRKVVNFPTPEAFGEFAVTLRQMAKEIPVSVTGLSDIAAAAGAAGIKYKDLEEFTRQAAIAAVAFELPAAQVGDTMAKLGNVFGYDIEQIVGLNDSVNHLSNSLAARAGEILDFTNRAAGAADFLGLTAEQLAGAGAALIAAGVKPETAARGFSALSTRIQTDANGVDEALRNIGLTTRGLQQALEADGDAALADLFTRLSDLDVSEQAAALKALVGQDFADDFSKLLKNPALLKDAFDLSIDPQKVGSALKEFEVRSETFGAAVQKFQSQFNDLKIVIGNALIPALSKLMEAVTPAIEGVAAFAEAHPALITNVVAAAGSLIAFKSALAALKFLGLLGRGGALSLLSIGMKTVGRASIHMHSTATRALALRDALDAASSQKRLSGLSRLRFATAAVARSAVPLGRMTRAVNGLKTAFTFLGGPLGVVVAAAGALALAMGSFKSPSDQFQQLTGDLNETLGEIETVNDALADDYEELEKANERLADAIESGAEAAEDAARRDIEAIQSRIDANHRYRDELAAVAKVQLAEARDALAKMEESQRADVRNSLESRVLSDAGGMISPQRVSAQVSEEDVDAELARRRAEALAAADAGEASRAQRSFLEASREISEARITVEREAARLEALTGELETTETPAPEVEPEVVAAPERSLRPVARSVVRPEVREAGKTLEATRLAGDLPTPAALQELEGYAEQLRSEIAAIQAEIDALVDGPMKTGIVQGKQPELDVLKQDLADIEQEIVDGNTRAAELTSALSILSDTDVTPEISTASIDAALEKVRALNAGLRSISSVDAGGAAAIPIDGQRASGGPVQSGKTYLIGEQGPEAVTFGRSGFVHNARATVGLLKGMAAQAVPKGGSVGFPDLETMIASAGSAVAATAGIPVHVAASGKSAPSFQMSGPLIGSLTVHRDQDPMMVVDQLGDALEQKLSAIMRGLHSDFGGT